MPIVLANLLRLLTIGSVGYSISDLVNWFQAKKAGQDIPAAVALKQIFFSWRFLVFLVVLIAGFYILLRERFRKR